MPGLPGKTKATIDDQTMSKIMRVEYSVRRTCTLGSGRALLLYFLHCLIIDRCLGLSRQAWHHYCTRRGLSHFRLSTRSSFSSLGLMNNCRSCRWTEEGLLRSPFSICLNRAQRSATASPFLPQRLALVMLDFYNVLEQIWHKFSHNGCS